MVKLSDRNRRALVLGGSVLALIVLVRFAVIPLANDWSHTRQRLAEAKDELSDLEFRIRRALGQQRRLEEAYGMGVHNPLSHADTARIGLFKASHEILKKGGFEVADYQPQSLRPLPQVPGVQIVPLQIRGKCQLPQLAKCIADMRQAEMLVMVDRVSVVNHQKKPGQLEVTIVLSTLAQTDKAGT